MRDRDAREVALAQDTEGHNTIYLIRLCAGSSQIYYCTQVWLEEKDGRRVPATRDSSVARDGDGDPVSPIRGRQLAIKRSAKRLRELTFAVPYLVKIAIHHK